MTDASSPTEKSRSWWPAAVAVGLIAAAIIGVVIFSASDDDTVGPVKTNPTTPPDGTTVDTVETVETTATTGSTTVALPAGVVPVEFDGQCLRLEATGATATGCIDQLDALDTRTIVADLGEPYLITFTGVAADPLAGAIAEPWSASERERCRWDEMSTRIETGSIVEIVVCDDAQQAMLVSRLSPDPGVDATWFTLAGPYAPDGTELGASTPVEGLPGALTFAAPVEGATCTMLLVPDRSGWKETCGNPELNPNPHALLVIGDELYEVTITTDGTVGAAVQLDDMPASNGCTLESAQQLIGLVPATSIVGGIGCLADDASLTSGSVLLQSGPPDGSIWLAARDTDGTWSITDNGTGIDDFSFPIAAVDTWTAWPGDTAGRPADDIQMLIDSVGVQPDVTTLTDQILTALGTLGSDPEFPPNPQVVASEPDGLPLLLIQVDVGGDDSVGGQVLFVWITQAYADGGPIGWQASQVLVSSICLRGTTGDLCV